MVAVARTNHDDDVVHMKNIQSKYKGHKCSLGQIKIELPPAGTYPQWYNYFLCGVKGIVDYLKKMGENHHRGFMVGVSGNIPPASGLSSSSALVCSAALTTAHLFNLPLNKNLLATLSASSERFIGTMGGGMDQAIAFLAKKGCAQYIEFNPIRATPIKLPSDAVFVIANSLSEANKAATGDFNQRVVECKIATKLLSKMRGHDWEEVSTLSQLQEALDLDLESFERLIKDSLTKDIYTKDELMHMFHVSSKDFEEKFLTPNTKNSKEFKLRQRALHVVSGKLLFLSYQFLNVFPVFKSYNNLILIILESLRVDKFCEIAVNADEDDEDDPIDQLSQILLSSHHSLNSLYECSHPNLNKLIDISKDQGVGARLVKSQSNFKVLMN